MADLNPLNWNRNQWQAFGKHMASAGAGAAGLAVTWSIIQPQTGTDITGNINDVVDGLTQAFKGLAALATAAMLAYTSLKSVAKSSPSSQIQSVVDNLSAPQITQAANAVADPGSRIKLIEAVAEMPEVKKIVPVSEAVALAIPSEKVTTS